MIPSARQLADQVIITKPLELVQIKSARPAYVFGIQRAASGIVEEYLRARDIKNPSNIHGEHKFYVSDLPAKFKEVADRFLGKPVKHIDKIDLEELIGH